ncbi:hypothetical protein LPJ59_002037 [Coemansia sp. RSA 2399]|nr:hypothetical protein LPJ59_002037 [Coemansia sp. RSA 2399]KAJ1907599.1 hypothetical protein LPJ81_000650 [Coemansia sp. IMI 209127]
MLSESTINTSPDIEGWGKTSTDNDDIWWMCNKQSATLPRAFHSSTVLRRRFMGGDDAHLAGDGDEFPYSHPPSVIYGDAGYSYSASGLLQPPRPPPVPASLAKVMAAPGGFPVLLGAQRIRMSMPADMGDSLSDFLPFAAPQQSSNSNSCNNSNKGTVAASASAAGTDGLQQKQSGIFGSLGEGNMLHALLSRLPEPPASCPNNSSIVSLTALADSLPVPPQMEEYEEHGSPLSPPPSSPSLSLSSSVDSTDSATPTLDTLRQSVPPLDLSSSASSSCTHAKDEVCRSAAAGSNQHSSTVAVDTQEAAGTLGARAAGLLGKTIPPAIDVSAMIVGPETPASSRRNTEEVPLSEQHRDQLQTLKATNSSSNSPVATLLDAEMPPEESPFFDNISHSDIRSASLSVRQRTTWCCAPPSMALSPSVPSLDARRASMALGLPEVYTKGLREPHGEEEMDSPVLPPFAQHVWPRSPAGQKQMRMPSPAARTYHVRVHGLFASPLSRKCNRCRRPRAILSEVNNASQPFHTTHIDANVVKRLRVSRAMRRALVASNTTSEEEAAAAAATGIRQPSCHCGAQAQERADLLSVSVSTKEYPSSPSDKRVRALDIEAMVASHLPHVFRRFRTFLGETDAAAGGAPEPHASHSAAEPSGSDERGASSVRRPPLGSATRSAPALCLSLASNRQQKALSTSRLPMPPGLRVQGRRSDASIVTTPTRIPLSAEGRRPPSSVESHHRLSTPPSLDVQRALRTTPMQQPIGSFRTQLPRPSVSRRRSEVQALISQANAVLGNNNGLFATAPRMRRLPPRASLPLSFTEPRTRLAQHQQQQQQQNQQHSQLLRHSSASPRASLLSMSSSLRDSRRLSCLSESEPDSLSMRLASPSSPSYPSSPSSPSQASLAAALRRQHHRLESARGDLLASSGDVSPLELTPVRNLGSDARGMHASTSFSGGTRIPIMRNNSGSAPSLRRLPSAGRLLRPTGDDCGASSLVRKVTVNQGRRRVAAAAASASALGNGSSDVENDYEFLTLRPVHTPDLVPCTIDPRLIERAMTPMLKTNIGRAQKLQPPPPPRSLTHVLVGSLVETMVAKDVKEDDEALLDDHCCSSTRSPSSDTHPPPRVSGFSATALSIDDMRNSVATTLESKSHISPLNSPELKPTGVGEEETPRRKSFGAGRFTMPASVGGLFSRSKKNSSKPVSAVSAIPMPPKSSAKKLSSGGGLSNIPSLSKAKSLWSLRSGKDKR